MKKIIHKTLIIYYLVFLNIHFGQAQTSRGILFKCPSLPPVKQHITTEQTRATADSLVHEGQTLLNADTSGMIADASDLFGLTKSDTVKVRALCGLLSSVHGVLNCYGGIPSELKREKAWADLHSAVSLNPDLVAALHPLALIAARGGHDYTCAETLYVRALKIEPSNAVLHFDYAELLAYQGKFKEAFRYAEKALTLADNQTEDARWWDVVRMHYMAHDYDWVIQQCDQHLALVNEEDIWNDAWPAYFYKGLALAEQGNVDYALAMQTLSSPVMNGDGFDVASMSRAYTMAGDTANGKRLLDHVLRPHIDWMPCEIAAAYEALGDFDNTFLWLSIAADEGDIWLRWLDHDPRWKRIRNDPRFERLRMRVGL